MKRKISVFLLVLACVGVKAGRAQMNDSIRVFIDSALNIMQRHSMYSGKVDWVKTRKEAFKIAAGANSYTMARPAIQHAFDKLGDKHGWISIDDVNYRNPAFKVDESRINANMKLAASKGPGIYAAIAEKNYAYISIPFFGGQTMAGMNAFARRLQDSLCRVITPQTKGFVVDLRLNAGGNMFAMLTGISNLLGNGIIFETKDASGNSTGQTIINNFSMRVTDSIVVSLKNNCGDYSRYPVAIIIGPITGSAGENLAVAIRGRDKTRLFGETTAGFTSGNQGFFLPGKDNGLVIGVDFLHDRFGKEYKENVQPDEFIIGGDDFFNHENDKKIAAALTWLRQQH